MLKLVTSTRIVQQGTAFSDKHTNSTVGDCLADLSDKHSDSTAGDCVDQGLP